MSTTVGHDTGKDHEHRDIVHGQTSSSLFSNGEEISTPNDGSGNDFRNALPTLDPEPPADFLMRNSTANHDEYRGAASTGQQHHDSNDDKAALLAQHAKTKWHKDDVILIAVLPTILTLLFGLSLRHCHVSNRRHARFHERRQSVRAAQRAKTREARRLEGERRKDRAREIERALVTKVSVCVFVFLHKNTEKNGFACVGVCAQCRVVGNTQASFPCLDVLVQSCFYI